MVTTANPVVRGFSPDPSFLRVGDWYLLAVSSFEWFPTIPIQRSRDLATWEFHGAVESAAPGRSLTGYPDSAGIWAPALSSADGVFWVVYSIVESLQSPYFNLATYIARAPEVDGLPGEWSEPQRVSGLGFDPSLFHHEGRHWLVNIQNDHRPGGNRFDGIVLTELVDDGGVLRTTGPTSLLLQRPDLVEGPKIIHHDGWFVLALAEGGTGIEHGVLMARSRSLHGPYEVDDVPLLTTRDALDLPLQKAGHGELIRTPSGRWYLGHLVSRPIRTEDGAFNTLGRESALQEIEWRDGWPRLKGGGWHPRIELDVPDVPHSAAGPTPPQSLLPWPWRTLRTPASRDWIDQDARPGWIRLRGRQGPESLREHSLIGQPLTEHRTTVSVTVDADPTSFTQAAGLVLWYNTDAYLSLHITWREPDGEPQRGQQWEGRGHRALVLTRRDPDGQTVLAVRAFPETGPVTLRADLDGPLAILSAGAVHTTPTRIGEAVDVTFLSDDHGPRLRFTGAFAGLDVVDLVDAAFTADFSGFRLRAEPVDASEIGAGGVGGARQGSS
ncbi:family 43 glycosylhydrolase [Rathayibacter sp. ZW T2_19]|uniref:Family 43 glycosylhydrolase n=1 Tax=Rathayibacter rubneri TaxID=2950106 RepID=A0A9X2DU84_9MICO|nr:family 43 glycosylhydrolase [Rathayibacter rubneri]MCM6761250.1 family 43 glycosylhydrolase [Rathayibacter rubneri]